MVAKRKNTKMKPKMKPKKSVDNDVEKYKKMTQHQHVLALPDTYVGGVEFDSHKMRVYDRVTNKIISKIIKFVPGLYKIYDEILVNSRDHSINDNTCTNIKITINKEDGYIECYNDGNAGIPVALKEIEDDGKKIEVYVPEMIFGMLLTSGNYETTKKIVGGRNGFGSKLCLKKGTLLPMYSGKVKKIEDIKQGEKLIGDDGKARRVTGKTEGNGKLYEVVQKKCEPYTVNENHMLSLRVADHKVIFWNCTEKSWNMVYLDKQEKEIKKKKINTYAIDKITCPEHGQQFSSNLESDCPRKHHTLVAPDTQEVKFAFSQMEDFAKTIPDDNTLDINIQDYMKLTKTTKSRLSGYVGKCVQWQHKDVEIDPYVLGLWLGYGYRNGRYFAINAEDDPEILEYLEKWGELNDAKFTPDVYNKIPFGISSLSKCGTPSLKKLLKKYKLINNKHIPKEYLVNSRNVRMKVLAGLIDSDGTVCREGSRISISQGMNHKKLSKDIIYLAKSLGLMCCHQEINTQWTHKGVFKKGRAIRINISGENAKDIPTLVARKKCYAPIKRDTTGTGKLSIREVPNGDYVGLAVDGNKRFVLNDFTVTHNCNIFSKEFYVEIGDKKRKKVFKQQFSNNMYTKETPLVTKTKLKNSYTLIRFKPDFDRFGIDGLSDDIISLFEKRVYDIAANTRPDVNVYLNNEKIHINTFEDYIGMFYDNDDDDDDDDDEDNIMSFKNKIVFEEFNERWRVGVVYDPLPGYQHISYVNGICTYKGGRHVEYIVNQIVKELGLYITSQKKYKDLNVKPAHIKDNLTIFIDSVIEDPSFTSQIKEELTNKVSTFGSECKISESFIKQLAKTGVIDEVINFAKLKEMSALKKTDGKKRQNLRGIDKLVDAHWAGGRKSDQCRLFLTEGDSAKAFAISGMDVIGKDKFGVFPLRGKLLNVREAPTKKLLNNEEIKNIKQIMGLKQGVKYTSSKDLRYGGIIILTDQDTDGSHIKGLVMNMFHYFWPSLLKIDGFIQSMATPIVKAWKTTDTKKKNAKIFYTLTEFTNWKEKFNGSLKAKGWKTKYYKGLGTSDEKEAKDSFNDFDNRVISYIWDGSQEEPTDEEKQPDNDQNEDESSDESDENENDDIEIDDIEIDDTKNESDSEDFLTDKRNKNQQAITLAFQKNLAPYRKIWLINYDKEEIIENTQTIVPYHEFINKDLIHFSNYDCVRSIASIVDGFKPGKRKIMFVAIKENLFRKEIKVAQLAGFVSAKAAYHHGEVSLQETIIGMAQTFVSANNLNLLQPRGNFGYRKQGGKDSASPRYIFTQLSSLVPYIFRKEDNTILNYVVDDGDTVEPEYYGPVIPMVLINSTVGIGTGFSSGIPQYNPIDVLENLRRIIKGQSMKEIYPWYKGFNANDKIIKLKEGVFRTSGLYNVVNETTIKITELPIGVWTERYGAFLETLIAYDKVDKLKPKKGQYLDSFKDDSGNNTICFTLKFLSGKLQQLLKTETLEKTLRLHKNLRTTNMHFYNKHGTIQKFSSINNIFTTFYEIRKEMYVKRKKYYLKVLENVMNLLKYKIKFIKYVTEGKIVIFKNKKAMKEAVILAKLEELKFPKLASSAFASKEQKTYSYIQSIRIFDVTPENMKKFEDEYEKVDDEYKTYENTTIENIWTSELDELELKYKIWYKDQMDELKGNQKQGKSKKKTGKKRKKKIKVMA
jgi:DNA topoisomerase-2